MAKKKIKKQPAKFCSLLRRCLEERDYVSFGREFMSGTTGRVRVSIKTILTHMRCDLTSLADCLLAGRVSIRKIANDCPESDSHKADLMAAMIDLIVVRPRNSEDKHPYVSTRAFVFGDVGHSDYFWDTKEQSRTKKNAERYAHAK